ncbi:MAG: CRISPR-associated endonuclease Cas2 [Ruminiclostridium sp.]|nr:CRISPR-associated endonuclease Cas2 [Ruminiclostridium sp.]
MKICRKYLIHVQKSVFEGLISDSKLNKLKKEITSSIDSNYDSVCIYIFGSLRYTEKEQIGIITDYSNIL